MNATIFRDRQSGRGRRTLRQACRPRRSSACGRLASNSKLRTTTAPGEAPNFARSAYARGFRNFLAVGGDGTSYEIVNGLFPEALNERPASAWFSSARHRKFVSAGFHHARRRTHDRSAARRQASRLRRDSAASRGRRNLFHESAEPGLSGRRGRTDQSPVQALGRTRLHFRRARAPGRASSTWRFRIASTTQPSGTAAPACFSPSATANSPAEK